MKNIVLFASVWLISVLSAADPQPVLITGVVICFSDESRNNYSCALVETKKYVYEAVWYPTAQTNVVKDGVFSYYCKQAPNTFAAVSFKVKQYITKTKVETLNSVGEKGAKPSVLCASQVEPFSNVIGDKGSTMNNHFFFKQKIAVKKG